VKPSPSAAIPPPGSHITALDGVRGLAILAVLVHHFTLYGGPRPDSLVDKAYYYTALTGWWGVDLFFVLSGFLITGILFDARGGAGFFRNFYMRRVLRIFPLYYGVLLVVFFLAPRFVEAGTAFGATIEDQEWYWSYLVNVRLAVRGWPEFPVLGHFWSLAVEEQFYLAWPFVVFALSRRALMRVSVACFVGALIFRVALTATGHELAAYVLTPCRMDALAAGAFLALAARGPGGLASIRRWTPAAGWVSGALLAFLFVWQRGLDTERVAIHTLGFSLLAILSGVAIVVALHAPRESWPGKVVHDRRLVFFGRYSYALYVFHHPIALLLPSLGISAAAMPRVFDSLVPGRLAIFVLGTLLSTGLALLSWHAWEAPFLRLKRLFPYGSRARLRVARSGQAGRLL